MPWRWLVLCLTVGFMVWSFFDSTLPDWAVIVGSLGIVLVGLLAFRTSGRWRLGPALLLLIGAPVLCAAAWFLLVTAGVFGTPERFPASRFSVPLSLSQMQGEWFRRDGVRYTLKDVNLCPSAGRTAQHPCYLLFTEATKEHPGSYGLLAGGDDVVDLTRAYRRWNHEYLDSELSGVQFSRAAQR